MTLPVLSAQQQITDTATGRPTSQFLRFMEDHRTGINDADVLLAATIADVQTQVDRLTAILAGTGEAFTGLKVGAQNVKTFLDKTDGAALTVSSGLGSGVVATAAVASNAITNEAATFTAAAVSQSGSTETTVQTVSYTTTGETLEVKANFFLTIWHPTAGGIVTTVRMYRGATNIYEQAFTAINGDVLQGWQTPTVIEEPAAGTYTFTVTVQTDVSNWTTAESSSRLLAVREFKR